MRPLSELPLTPVGSHKAGLLVVGPFIHPSFGVSSHVPRGQLNKVTSGKKFDMLHATASTYLGRGQPVPKINFATDAK